MKIMGVTLNKDGTPRKIGSGKTKGAGCYESVLLRDLRKFLNEDDEVSVSRVWLRNAKANQRGNTISLDLGNENQLNRTDSSSQFKRNQIQCGD